MLSRRGDQMTREIIEAEHIVRLDDKRVSPPGHKDIQLRTILCIGLIDAEEKKKKKYKIELGVQGGVYVLFCPKY